MTIWYKARTNKEPMSCGEVLVNKISIRINAYEIKIFRVVKYNCWIIEYSVVVKYNCWKIKYRSWIIK